MLMEQEGGPVDQEEMQEIVSRMRSKSSRRPPEFQACPLPLKGLFF